MKIDTFTPISIDGGQIPKVQPAAPQAFPDVGQIKKSPEALPSEPAEPVQQSNAVQGSSLSHYLNSEEQEMIGRLFPGSGRNTAIHAYQQTKKPVEPRQEILGQRIDIIT